MQLTIISSFNFMTCQFLFLRFMFYSTYEKKTSDTILHGVSDIRGGKKNPRHCLKHVHFRAVAQRGFDRGLVVSLFSLRSPQASSPPSPGVTVTRANSCQSDSSGFLEEPPEPPPLQVGGPHRAGAGWKEV